MSFDLNEAFGEFIAECDEITQRISHNLQEIEKNAATPEIYDSIYRDVHTLKGSANLYGFTQTGQLAHAMEAGLEPFRKQLIPIGSNTLDILFCGLDILEKMIKSISKDKKELDVSTELSEIIPKLIDSTIETLSADVRLNRDVEVSGSDHNQPANFLKEVTQVSPKTSEEHRPQVQVHLHDTKIGNANMASDGHKTKADVSGSGGSGNGSDGATPVSEASQTIRVQISRLDKLMNLIGEMVLTRNQVLQFTKQSEDSDFLKLGKRLDQVTSELQGEVMQTRMQPIGTVLEKFQRVVRDLNKELGKKIEIVLIGNDTEVDKSLLEAVKDPLTHLIRNSCDHGLEPASERKLAGKNETGKVTVRSYHEGGQVVIEINDDGRGLDREKILKKAVEKNIVAQKDVAALSDQEIYNFIFAPGFSTAQTVTTVSGRGVGMDVVKTNIEKIGGTVELATLFGQSTTVRLRIPLTLAIVPAMVIRVGENRFSIPQVKLVELVRAEKSDHSGSGGDDSSGRNKLEYLQGRPMFRMRGQLLPLVSLKEILQLKDDSDLRHSKSPAQDDGVTNIVVLNGDGCQFGLIVDEIQDTTDIVVKPLSKFLKNLSVYAGATIMGDGSVVLIFDVAGIAKRAELSSEKNEIRDRSLEKAISKESQEFLLFKTTAPARHAMALCLVQRLEEFDNKKIEYAGEQPVIRYRDTILPLVNINACLEYKVSGEEAQKEKVSVIVVQRSGKNFGLVVDEILDVITTESMIDDTVKDRAGILGGLLQGQEVIVVVDPLDIIDSEFKKMSQRHFGSSDVTSSIVEKANTKYQGLHILFAEDTAFFRKQVARALERVGIKVTSVVDGQEAMEKLESAGDGEYNLVLSDIEMPRMTGLELAAAVRKNEKLNKLPMIALTTKYRDADREEGARVGFDLFLEKFNPEDVLNGITKVLNLERKVS
jgi:two-component system chemotaxis sensor kinase CheA